MRLKKIILSIGVMTILLLVIFTTPFLAKEQEQLQTKDQLKEDKLEEPRRDRVRDGSCYIDAAPPLENDEVVEPINDKEQLRDQDQLRDCEPKRDRTRDRLQLKDCDNSCEGEGQQFRHREQNQAGSNHRKGK